MQDTKKKYQEKRQGSKRQSWHLAQLLAVLSAKINKKRKKNQKSKNNKLSLSSKLQVSALTRISASPLP